MLKYIGICSYKYILYLPPVAISFSVLLGQFLFYFILLILFFVIAFWSHFASFLLHIRCICGGMDRNIERDPIH